MDRTSLKEWAAVESDPNNSVAVAIRLARSSAMAVARGVRQACYLSGPPGIGKNKIIDDALKVMGARSPIRCNPHNYRHLVKDLNRAQGKAPLVCDEADVIFRTVRMLNVMKSATQLVEEARVYDGQKVGAVIFVATNDDLNNDKLWDKNVRLHHEALFERAQPVCIPGDSRFDLWEWSVHIGITTPLLSARHGGGGISLSARNDALNFFTVNLWRLKVVSPRTLHTIAQTMHDFRGDPTLPHHLENLLKRDPRVDGPIPRVPTVPMA